MCTAQAVVTSKWWLVLNVLRPSKCFISTLVEGIRGELKENTWRPFSMAWTGQPPGLCVCFSASQEAGGRTGWGAISSGDQQWERESQLLWPHFLCYRNSLTKALFWNLRQAFTPKPKCVPNGMCCLGQWLFLTLLGMHHLLSDWVYSSRTVCCGDCCKLESVPLGC